MSVWQLQEAKARLSELVKRTQDEGAQHITLHGRLAAVLISPAEYESLQQPKPNLVEFMRNSPWAGFNLDVGRTQDAGRDVDLSEDGAL